LYSTYNLHKNNQSVKTFTITFGPTKRSRNVRNVITHNFILGNQKTELCVYLSLCARTTFHVTCFPAFCLIIVRHVKIQTFCQVYYKSMKTIELKIFVAKRSMYWTVKYLPNQVNKRTNFTHLMQKDYRMLVCYSSTLHLFFENIDSVFVLV